MKRYTGRCSKVGAEYELRSQLEDMKSHWELLQTLISEKIGGEVISEGRERISFWVAKEYVLAWWELDELKSVGALDDYYKKYESGCISWQDSNIIKY